MGILGLLLTFVFNFVAVVMVWRTNDIWIDVGIILLQVFFICYQIYISEKNEN